jgi:hypothetical protein
MLTDDTARDQTADYDVIIATLNADEDFNAFVDDVKRNDLDAAEVGEPVEPAPAPERRTHPEYAAIKSRDTILGTIDPATAPAFLALVESRYNRPDVLTVDPISGEVTYAGPANELLYGGRILGPDEALELGVVIADHLGNQPLCVIEVEPVSGGYFRAVRVYPWGARIECAGLHLSPDAAAKYGAWMIQTERLTVAKVATVEAGETRGAA